MSPHDGVLGVAHSVVGSSVYGAFEEGGFFGRDLTRKERERWASDKPTPGPTLHLLGSLKATAGYSAATGEMGAACQANLGEARRPLRRSGG